MTAVQELRNLSRVRMLQLLTLLTLMCGVGWRSFYLKYCVLDLDIWWHLKVGDWIIQTHAVPHTGVFSSTGANLPWVAYSWGYEVLLSLAYSWLGLLGVGLFGVLLTLAVAYVMLWMLRRLSGRFWMACILGAATYYPFLFTMMPRPVFFSMVLFMVTLTLILESQRSGRIETLYWLPFIFLLWANLHIQFIYGLFLFGLFVSVAVTQSLTSRLGIAPDFILPPSLPADKLAAIMVACIVATCVGPNSYHPYQVVFEYSKAKFTYANIIELQALDFRYSEHYVQLLLTAVGFFAVGWRKKIDPFQLALLTFASLVAYRTMRDSWFICIPAAACIADSFAEKAERDVPETLVENIGLAGTLAIVLVLIAGNTDFSERGLDRAVSGVFPVNAVNFIRQYPVAGPLYNSFDWGGFLIWYMPNYPVAIDGRNDLYGDGIDERFISTQNGDASYTKDAYLNESGVVLLQKSTRLASLLNIDSRFRLVYQDALSVVFVRQ